MKIKYVLDFERIDRKMLSTEKESKKMTWKELEKKISSLSEKEKSEKVPVFVFVNGEMSHLEDVQLAPGKLGTHCHNINKYKDKHYLFVN